MQQQGGGYVNLSVKLLTRGARCCCFPNLHPGKLIQYRNKGTELREEEEEKTGSGWEEEEREEAGTELVVRKGKGIREG